MRFRPPALLVVLLTSNLLAQSAPTRTVTGSTLVSKADPAASFTIASAFQYAGGQVIDILKVAGAEQHFFLDAAPDHSIRRFYWLQFEHYYPDNTHSYDYSGFVQQAVPLGRLAFMGDIRTSEHYFTMDDRPGSDSKAAESFLRMKGYKLDGTFVTLRLFHLPDATNRRELMVIYGELLRSHASEAQVRAQIAAHAQHNIAIR
jgi:hypothetical protein